MEQVITDKAGRRLTLRKMGMLELLRLFKALGPDLSMNRSYLGLATVVSAVSMIDEVPVPFPANEAAVEALIDRLGDDAIAAVAPIIKSNPVPEMVAEAGN
jgi:hypothetical protein